jgi:hypothetical protein
MPCPFPLQCLRKIVRNLSSAVRGVWFAPPFNGFGLTADEQSIASEHDFLVSVFHKVADAVLGMTGRMERCDFDAIANFERFFMCGGLGHFRAVFATNDRDRICFELLNGCQHKCIALATEDTDTISALPPA